MTQTTEEYGGELRCKTCGHLQYDIALEFDLEDLRRLHRLVELGAAADVIDPDNERVLAFVAFQLALAEKAAQ